MTELRAEVKLSNNLLESEQFSSEQRKFHCIETNNELSSERKRVKALQLEIDSKQEEVDRLTTELSLKQNLENPHDEDIKEVLEGLKEEIRELESRTVDLENKEVQYLEVISDLNQEHDALRNELIKIENGQNTSSLDTLERDQIHSPQSGHYIDDEESIENKDIRIVQTFLHSNFRNY